MNKEKVVAAPRVSHVHGHGLRPGHDASSHDEPGHEPGHESGHEPGHEPSHATTNQDEDPATNSATNL